MRINFTVNSKDLPDDITDELWTEGLCIAIESEDMDGSTPMPWDAGWGFEMIGSVPHLVIAGGAGPSGYGSCTVKVPLMNSQGQPIPVPYYLELTPDDEDDFVDRVWPVMKRLGYEVFPSNTCPRALMPLD